MGRNYYAVLDIDRSSKLADIQKAYRKLALKCHPAKNPDNQVAADQYLRLAEAYDVLSDARKRAVFDQFGEEGLRAGVPEGSGQAGAWTSGYVFHGNADKVFMDFFGSDNPYQEFYDRVDGDMHMSFGGLHGRGQRKKDPAIEQDLQLTLEELFHGCIKKIQIQRRVMNDDGHTSSTRDKILTVNVKKGMLEGHNIIFPEEGDQGPNNISADIIFKVCDKEHPRFKRCGSDLIHVAKIPLGRALTSHVVDIYTLDERLLHVPINDIVNPTYTKTLPGEGMPFYDNPRKRGDLIIQFDVIFPRKLSPEQKEMIEKALCT